MNSVEHSNPWVARFASPSVHPGEKSEDEVSRLPVPAPTPDRLVNALGKNPPLISSAVHGSIGATMGSVLGASAGAVAGMLWWPAHVGAVALVGGMALGGAAAAHGWAVGDRVRDQIGLPQASPSKTQLVGGDLHDALTTSTGSFLVDAAIGALVGYALSPTLGWIVAGALLGGLAGIGGVALLVGARLVERHLRPAAP